MRGCHTPAALQLALAEPAEVRGREVGGREVGGLEVRGREVRAGALHV